MDWLNRCTVERDGLRVILEATDVTIDDVLQAFKDVLKGCGFVFDGEVVLVDEDE